MNDFLLMTSYKEQSFIVYIHNNEVTFPGLHDPGKDTWNSICATWKPDSKLSQIWINGNPSEKKAHSRATLYENPTIILGQEQDSVGGGFNLDQSFAGKMTDVHMWDYVLSACEIRRFARDFYFTPGNVLNWKALDYSTTGSVSVEDKA
ncbi:serum amyloid P-component-like [Sardina pilchardus]|uniref:serum amyloid P-component-like n=1 Tax=Sardina pilchardus TaxID=27697 RepID=UPI002E1367BA